MSSIKIIKPGDLGFIVPSLLSLGLLIIVCLQKSFEIGHIIAVISLGLLTTILSLGVLKSIFNRLKIITNTVKEFEIRLINGGSLQFVIVNYTKKDDSNIYDFVQIVESKYFKQAFKQTVKKLKIRQLRLKKRVHLNKIKQPIIVEIKEEIPRRGFLKAFKRVAGLFKGNGEIEIEKNDHKSMVRVFYHELIHAVMCASGVDRSNKYQHMIMAQYRLESPIETVLEKDPNVLLPN